MGLKAIMHVEPDFKFVIDLYENDAPRTVENFCKLVNRGFYNGRKFFKVIPGFVAQTGCPDDTGLGFPGFQIPCELDGENQVHDLGVLSMAHCGRDTANSQFFICLSQRNTQCLNGNHTCFGKIGKKGGVEFIDNIAEGAKIIRVQLANG